MFWFACRPRLRRGSWTKRQKIAHRTIPRLFAVFVNAWNASLRMLRSQGLKSARLPPLLLRTDADGKIRTPSAGEHLPYDDGRGSERPRRRYVEARSARADLEIRGQNPRRQKSLQCLPAERHRAAHR